MGKIPAAGIYIIMIANVAKELLKFLFLYATFMVGFATSFHILRGETYPEYFGDPLSSFMTTFAMMIGELNYVDLVTNVSFFYISHYLSVSQHSSLVDYFTTS